MSSFLILPLTVSAIFILFFGAAISDRFHRMSRGQKIIEIASMLNWSYMDKRPAVKINRLKTLYESNIITYKTEDVELIVTFGYNEKRKALYRR